MLNVKLQNDPIADVMVAVSTFILSTELAILGLSIAWKG